MLLQFSECQAIKHAFLNLHINPLVHDLQESHKGEKVFLEINHFDGERFYMENK